MFIVSHEYKVKPKCVCSEHKKKSQAFILFIVVSSEVWKILNIKLMLP